MGNRRNRMAEATLEAGKREFLKYGHEQASLRRVVGGASMTTGAICGYFPDRGTLFEALTRDMAEKLVDVHVKTHEDFAALMPDEQSGMLSDTTEGHIPQMVNFICDHFDAFKLLMCRGVPRARDGFSDKLAAVEEKSCWGFVGVVKTLRYPAPGMSGTLTHILCRFFLQQLHEFVSHDASKEQTVSCPVTLSRFQHAGWIRILGL